MPSRFHIFPWTEKESLVSGKSILRPMVDVRVKCGGFGTACDALIDTGAPITMLPRGIGDLLGLDFPDEGAAGEEIVTVLGHEWQVITRTVTLILPPFEDLEWEAPVRFAIAEGLNFGLLGYEGFLNQWGVSFNAYAGYFVVEPLDSFATRLGVDPWTEFQKDWDGWDRPGS